MYGENVLVIHYMLGTQWAWALRTCLATRRDMPPPVCLESKGFWTEAATMGLGESYRTNYTSALVYS